MSFCRDIQIFLLNIAELILIIIIAGLIADAVCFDCFHHFFKNQFINGVVYGFLIVCALILLEFYLPCLYSCVWHFIVAVLGAILLFVVAILILEYVSRYPNFADRIIFIRLVFAGVLSLVLSGAFVMNALLFVLKEEGCEPCEAFQCW